MEFFHVVQYTTAGKFVTVISGMGKNKGTWDSSHSRSAAYRHASQLRTCDEPWLKGFVYKVEQTV